MDTQEFSIAITDVLIYKDKKTTEDRIRIGYYFTEDKYVKDTKTQKGYRVQSFFGKDVSVFDKLKQEMFLKPCLGVFKQENSAGNPFQTYAVLTQLIFDDVTIDIA